MMIENLLGDFRVSLRVAAPSFLGLEDSRVVLWWSSIHRRIELMMPIRHPLSQQVCRASICEHSVNTELIDGNNDVIFIFIFMRWKTQATMLHLEKKYQMCQCVWYNEGTLKNNLTTPSTRMQRVKSTHWKFSQKTLHCNTKPTLKKLTTCVEKLLYRAPQHCEFGLFRGSVLCDSRRPNFTGRLYGCCNGGTVHVICYGPRRPSFTRTLRYRILLWHFAFRFQEGELYQRTLPHRILSWHSSLRFQDAELYPQAWR